METITKSNTFTEKLISDFELSKQNLFGNLSLREKAIEQFSALGIPGRKSEEYKYVNLELIFKNNFLLNNSKNLSSQAIISTQFLKNVYLVVIENGHLNAALSNVGDLPKGVHVLDISNVDSNDISKIHYAKYADSSSDAFIALNTAFASGGVFIHIEKGVVLEKPIHVVHLSTLKENAFIYTRNLIVVDSNSQSQIIESFISSDSETKIFTNALSEIIVSEEAILAHYKIQDEQISGYLMSTTQVYQKKKSVFTTNTYTLSGSLVRNNLNIVLDDEFIESHLNGLYLTKGNQVIDNHTLVDHRKPNCNSNELYKGIIEEKSAATFNGKIYVRKDAQKTNAFQSNKNILLSDDGTINTKPQLEIYADDVKCSHGTSTGKLDEEKIFYLRARGLSEASAKKLLMFAFASEVLESTPNGELKEYLEAKISARFG